MQLIRGANNKDFEIEDKQEKKQRENKKEDKKDDL